MKSTFCKKNVKLACEHNIKVIRTWMDSIHQESAGEVFLQAGCASNHLTQQHQSTEEYTLATDCDKSN